MPAIQHDGSRFWTGSTPANEQVLFGASLPNIVVYYFDRVGTLARKELLPLQTPLMIDPDSGYYLTGPAFMEALEREIGQTAVERSISLGAIRVEPFFDTDEGVGVKELPSDFEYFLEHPDKFAGKDAESLRESIDQWRTDESFVLVWGEELWMSKDGEILAT